MDKHISNDNNNPINWNGNNSNECECCGIEESKTYFIEDTDICEDCHYSCCGDELDQDNRRCPTCKENN